MRRIALAAMVVLTGCSDGDRVPYLEKQLSQSRASFDEQEKVIARLRSEIKELKSQAAGEKEEAARRIEIAEARARQAEHGMEREQIERILSSLVSELNSAALQRGDHIIKELWEAREEPRERTHLIKSFWREELRDLRRLKALEDMVRIVKAVREYRFEEGRYPPTGAKELSSTLLKPRKITKDGYLSPRPTELGPDGELLDPWGRPYVYVENASRQLPELFPNRKSFLLYSLGPNGKDETAPEYAPGGDDVCSWGR